MLRLVSAIGWCIGWCACLAGSASALAPRRGGGGGSGGDLAAVPIIPTFPLNVTSGPAPSNDPTYVTLPNGDSLHCIPSTDYGGETIACRAVPYGTPPLGALRWTAPTKRSSWGGVLEAQHDPPGCIQSCGLPPGACPTQISEDCLYLNVFAPRPKKTADDTSPGYAVMAFMHGGNFQAGFCGGLLYDGTYAAATTMNTIIVTLNYRLGAFGYVQSPEAGFGGSVGIMDQQLAFQWIQENIGAFGGDPNKVTIFGQSAGAQSVATHLVMPSSAGLFQRAITESDPASLRYRTQSEASQITGQLADHAGCPNPATKGNATAGKSCLYGASSAELLSAWNAVNSDIWADFPYFLELFEPWVPIINDGMAGITDDPWAVFQRGDITPGVDVIMGTVENEAVQFVYGALHSPVPSWEYPLFISILVNGSNAAEVEKLYPVTNKTDLRPQGCPPITDSVFRCVDRNMTLSALGYGPTPTVSPPVSGRFYQYLFNHIPSISTFMWGENNACDSKVCHADELPFVFHPTIPYHDAYNITLTPAELSLSATMVQYWTSFAHTGVPSADNAPAWPEFAPQCTDRESCAGMQAPATTYLMEFLTDGPVVRKNWLTSNCSFWDSVGYNLP